MSHKRVTNGAPGEIRTPDSQIRSCGTQGLLVKQYRLDPATFQWPEKPSAAGTEPTSEPSLSKQPRPTTTLARGKGISKLVEHPDWTHRRIAKEVNGRIEGAKASEKSVRWYASRMRRRGDEVPSKRTKT
jgi:hypothetical protein